MSQVVAIAQSWVIRVGTPHQGLVLLQWDACFVFPSSFIFFKLADIGLCAGSGSCTSSFGGVFMFSHVDWLWGRFWVGIKAGCGFGGIGWFLDVYPLSSRQCHVTCTIYM